MPGGLNISEQGRARSTLLRVGLLACIALLALIAPALAAGQTLHVTSSADGTGPGTLAGVIESATSGDTVVIDPGVEPLVSQAIPIDTGIVTGLTIEGQGARSTTISGGGKSRLFLIEPTNSSSSSSGAGGAGSPAVSFSGLTLADALSGSGAALVVDAPVSLTDVALVDNRADGAGGAIDDLGPSLTLTDVTADANRAFGVGGGVLYVGAGASATVVNSTLTGNLAGSGGALYNDGKLSLIDDTVAGNAATNEGGANNLDGTGPTTLQNTIVDNGPAATGPNCLGTSFVSAGGNLEDTSPSQCGLTQPSDLVGVDPLLGPLADNGGPTDTMALLPGSPAIGHIPAANCQSTVDQRGLPRPGVGKPACDIGAYEAQGAAVAVSCAPAPVADEQSSTCTATVTAPAGFPPPTPDGVVSFSSAGPGTFTPASVCTLAGSGATATCAVTYTPTAIGSGSHAVTATYGGNGSYPGSSGSTNLSVTPRPTSVAVTCSPAPVASGQTTTCTATVTDQLGAAAGPPAGVVTFSAGGSGTFGGGGACLLAGSGATASCSVPFTAGASGSPAVTAAYAGDGAHGGAGAAAAFVVIVSSKASTTLGLSCSPGTVAIGASTTCTVTVAPAHSGSSRAPTGSVVFSASGGKALSGGGTCTLTAKGAAGRCAVRYTLGSAANGTYTISAAYGGDSAYARGGAMTTVATPPVAGQAANISVISGTVLIKLPSSRTFVPALVGRVAADSALAPLKGSTLSVPMGSTINALKGKLALVTAGDYQPRTHRHRSLQRGTFSAGLFAVKQLTARQARRRLRRRRRLTGIPATILGLQTPIGAVAKAGCSRRHPPAKGAVRGITGDAIGLFETVAANSITIVHSALWNVQDRCGGSFTEVGRGHATVTPTRHAARHQHTVVVGPGQGVLIKGVFR